MSKPRNQGVLDNSPLRTTTATVTTLAEIQPVSSQLDGFAVWEFRVVAVQDGGTYRAYFSLTAGFQQTAGTVVLVGSVVKTVIQTISGVFSLDANIDLSSPRVRVRVTGAGGLNLDWYLQASIPLASDYTDLEWSA